MAHRRSTLTLLALALAAPAIAACSGLLQSEGTRVDGRTIDPELWDPSRGDDPLPPSYALEAVTIDPLGENLTADADCASLAAKRRRAALRQLAFAMVQSERNMRQQNTSCAEWGDRGGWASGADSGVVSPSPGGMVNDSSAAGPSATTGTNNQVASVDEADFVKNDGHFFYVLANGKFQVVDAWPADATHRIGQLDLSAEGTPKSLLMVGNTAYAFLATPGDRPRYGYGDSPYAGMAAPDYTGNGDCTYGYECTPTGDGTFTRVVAIDFTDKAAPRIVRRIDFRGSLLAARKVGSRLHSVIVRSAGSDARFVPYVPFPGSCGSASAEAIRAAHEAAYVQAKAAILAADFAPESSFAYADDGVPSPMRCEDIAVQFGGLGASTLTVASFDGAAAHGPIETASLNAEPGFVYASEERLYVASPERTMNGGYWGGVSRSGTWVHRFTLGNGTKRTAVDASGRVPGGVIGQFAMDERDGFLRMATTIGHAFDPTANSVLSVLERQGDRLATVAKIDGIAPSEDIRSVRFDGDRGYVVTFKKTDPLYTFDLANPRAPRLLGELKIPGFSTYMHPIDRNHLLTMGFNASDQGSFAWFTSVRLQIIDISDLANPRLTFTHDIGTRGTTSEALTNHLAFTYFPQKKLLALPMEICEGGNQNGGYGDRLTFSGLLVFGVDTATGFALKGGVDHRAPTASNPNGTSTPFYGCGTWWTQAHSTVERSAFFDDYVYSIDRSQMKVQDTRNLGRDLSSVRF